MVSLCSAASAEGFASTSPKRFRCKALHTCSGLVISPPAVAEPVVDVCRCLELLPQGSKDARSREEENLWQRGQRVSTAHCAPQRGSLPPTITHRLPPASPMGAGSSWRGAFCPHPGNLLAALSALHIHWLPSRSYLSIVIPAGPDPPHAAMLGSFPGELGRGPCFQGQLNSPRNLTHNFHLAVSLLLAMGLDWRPPDFTLPLCCRSQGVSGWQTHLPTQRVTPAPSDGKHTFNQTENF